MHRRLYYREQGVILAWKDRYCATLSPTPFSEVNIPLWSDTGYMGETNLITKRNNSRGGHIHQGLRTNP